ncbi:hypothetical protein BDN67DRAFT_1006193 [Paxillus ammoniavirescens]|nr:hypothetical protein BDN67DRAFT_1006193 [Paxillus ammoniavirescens]
MPLLLGIYGPVAQRFILIDSGVPLPQLFRVRLPLDVVTRGSPGTCDNSKRRWAAHIGYFVPLTKIVGFFRVEVEVNILLSATADIHASLDDLKNPLDPVAHRTKYH